VRAVRFGVPFTEFDTVFFGVGRREHEASRGTALPNSYFPSARPSANHLSVPLTVGWARDAARQRWSRRPGRYQRVNFELGCGGDTRYLRTNSQFQQYIPLTNRFTLGLNAELGYGKGLAASRTRLQELLRWWPGHGARFRAELARPVDDTGAYIGGSSRQRQRRVVLCRSPVLGQ
jgi:outer membrane protein insertion porin family